ncbi:MAG: xanthine phosphoribosyltransferase [Clostridia bacterium]
MRLLQEFILKEGRVVGDGLLKVDGFLNHQINVKLLKEAGKEFFNLFKNDNITKILTVEASGIGIACVTAGFFDIPVVFAKKQSVKTQCEGVYTAEVFSFTHSKKYDIRISKEYLSHEDRILIIDDFLASGEAARGLISLASQAGATIAGMGAVIEKGFQGGGDSLRKSGVRVESLAIIDYMDTSGTITFR